jgi:hypothetical protein
MVMKKPLLSTSVEETPEDLSLDQPDILEEFEDTKMHSRFNPSRIGFGILGVTKDVDRAGTEKDRPRSRRDRE